MMMTTRITDCHVNIWEDRHLLPAFAEQTATARPGSVGLKADADTLYRAMAKVDKAIIFSLRYGDSAGIDGDDEVTAAAVRKYPDKLVGFACVDPRRSDCMELLRHAIEDLKLSGVKYGPIYNGVHLNDPRMEPIYRYCVEHDLPLIMHMGTTFARNASAELGRPVYVDEVARRSQAPAGDECRHRLQRVDQDDRVGTPGRHPPRLLDHVLDHLPLGVGRAREADHGRWLDRPRPPLGELLGAHPGEDEPQLKLLLRRQPNREAAQELGLARLG